MTSDTKSFVGHSLLFHAAIVLAFTIKLSLFPSQTLKINNAIRVDMVALPDKTPVAKPPPAKVKAKPKAPAKKPKKKPKKKAKPKDPTKKQSDALKKLRQQMALEKLQDDQVQPQPVPKKQEHKGNIITGGDSFSGLERLHFDEYFPKLKAHLRDNWILPQWLADASLKAKVQVVMDRNGLIEKSELVTSSGNDVFDQSVLAAVNRSSPFPEPPGRLKSVLAGQVIEFSFPD